jgi:opine dehydrogenase
MKQIKKIAVIGGGNIGTQFACTCAAKGYEVNIHTTTPDLYDGMLTVIGDTDALTYSARVSLVTDDIVQAINGCDVIFVTHPASRFEAISQMLAPYIKAGVILGVLPGIGGAEYSFRKCIDKGVTLFGLQRVPAVARLLERGHKVRVSGIRERLYLASIPVSEAEELAAFISGLFDMPCEVLPNYLSVTLTPSNPILHTTRLYTMFKDYKEGVRYDRNILFYEEWTDEASRMLLACDSELQDMCQMLTELDLSNVRSLRLHYESETPEQLTKKIHSIKSFAGLGSPMKRVTGGWIPDFTSRYFSTDFPYGLAIIEELAEIMGYDAKHIKIVMDWYRAVSGNTKEFDIHSYGIDTVDDIYKLYCR